MKITLVAGRILKLKLIIKTKLQTTNKMTTKNKFSENDFNATIGNSVLQVVVLKIIVGIK